MKSTVVNIHDNAVKSHDIPKKLAKALRDALVQESDHWRRRQFGFVVSENKIANDINAAVILEKSADRLVFAPTRFAIKWPFRQLKQNNLLSFHK